MPRLQQQHRPRQLPVLRPRLLRASRAQRQVPPPPREEALLISHHGPQEGTILHFPQGDAARNSVVLQPGEE